MRQRKNNVRLYEKNYTSLISNKVAMPENE